MSVSLFLFYILGALFVVSGSIVTYILCIRRRVARIPRRFLFFLMGFVLYIPIAEILKYRSLHMYVDLSDWMQVLYTIGTQGVPASPNLAVGHPGFTNYFAAHFVPLVYVFALPFKFLPYGETIFVLNALFMFSAVIPLYKLGFHTTKSRVFALVLATVLLWYPTFQYMTLYEFEMLRFSIPILLWMLYFFERNRVVPYVLFALLAVLVREEVGVTLFFFGVYVWLGRKKRVLGIATSFLGVGASLIFMGLVMPAFVTGDPGDYIAAAGTFHQWGRTIGEIVFSIVTHPLRVLSVMMDPMKLANLFMLLLPFLFIPLLAPGALFAAAGSIGIGLLSMWPLHLSYFLYYPAPAIPFFFYAFMKAWPRLMHRLTRVTIRISRDGMAFVPVAALCAVLTGVLVSNIWFGPSPFSLQFWSKHLRPAPFRTQDFHWSVYRVTEHHRRINHFIAQIPHDAVISTEEFLLPRLFQKKSAMVFPRLVSEDGMVEANYVFLDSTHNGISSESPVVFHITQEALAGIMDNADVWKLVDSDGVFYLYKRIENAL